MLRSLQLILTALIASQLLPAQQTLTPTEADAIIAAQESAKADRKAARLAELEKAQVISEGQGTLPDGRKVIIREVKPPALELPNEPVENPTVALQFTPDQLALIEQNKELESHKVQMLSCTVYDRNITEVRWSYEKEKFVAYTNADFNYLPGIMTVSTETDRYDYFFGIGNVSSDQIREPLPALPAFSPDRSEYVLLEGNPDNTAATAGLKALLPYYDANLDSLKSAYQRNEALTAAKKRYKEANPEPKEDFILQFWVPEKKGPRE